MRRKIQGIKLLLPACVVLSACALHAPNKNALVSGDTHLARSNPLFEQSIKHDQLVGKPLSLVLNLASTCRLSLGQSEDGLNEGLDADNIRFLSWNIQKAQNTGWHQDLGKMANDRDLVLIQEASLEQGFIHSVNSANYWSFARGYSTSDQQTGVITFSRSKPLTRCAFSDVEPWLRTPKATSITEYALKNTPQTLVVVNIHAINFSLNLEGFRRQIVRVEKVLAKHQGPIIFSGDFNTWSVYRSKIVQQVVANLGMSELLFEHDVRTRVFGQHLDHIYIRGLDSLKSSTMQVGSSDHNPMFATFKI